jgi:ABC-type polysaccharide/polyol phosphate export permease
MYDNTAASLASFGIMVAISFATLLIGWLVFTHCADDIAYRG